MKRDTQGKDESGPERTCIVTRRRAAPEAMIRFVVGPDSTVVPDLRRKLPGRGVWASADAATIATAVRTRAFSRGFKAQVTAAADLPEAVGALIERDALQFLAVANKAGVVTTGFAKVEAALAAGGIAAVLHATDAGADGVRKLESAAKRQGETAQAPISIKLFSSQQLDLALGRTNVIHAALAVGPASDAFLTRCRRSIQYRATATHPNPGATAAPGENAPGRSRL